MNLQLQPGLEVHCVHCQQWHVVEQPYAASTTAERDHAYMTCGPHRYFAGQIGQESRWPVRMPDSTTQKKKGGA